MATEKWVAGSGQGLTWGTAMNSSDVAGLASSNSILSTVADITNGTALDIFADFSISFSSMTPAAPAYLGVYLYPLNEDGATYGDNQFAAGTAGSVIPSATYYVGSIILSTKAIAQDGMLQRIVMPPGSFRFLLQNQLAATVSTTATVKYRTYNRSIA